MKVIRKCLFFLFLAQYALLARAEFNCPPTSTIRDLQFIKVDGVSDIWDLFSKPIYYDAKNWEVIFTVYLPHATNQEEALRQGDEFYRTDVIFFRKPMGVRDGNRLKCYYAQQESAYFVRAISQ